MKSQPTTHITPAMTTVFGLRPGVALDEKLARALCDPASKCTERFIYSRGLCAVYVSGMYVQSVGSAGEGRRWLADCADRLQELPHLKQWAAQI